MHLILVPQSPPTIKQAITRLKPFGCIVRPSHTEILSQEEKNRKQENKLKNIYIISFHIRTMHTTGNPPEKPWLRHQLYRHTRTTLREKETDASRIQWTCLCHSLPVKTHKLYSESSSPGLVYLSVSVCLHSPPAPRSLQMASSLSHFTLFNAFRPAKQTVVQEKCGHHPQFVFRFLSFFFLLLGFMLPKFTCAKNITCVSISGLVSSPDVAHGWYCMWHCIEIRTIREQFRDKLWKKKNFHNTFNYVTHQ